MSWSHRWFGFWIEDGMYASQESVMSWHQPEWWKGKDKASVLHYLDQGVTLSAVGSRSEKCHICGQSLPRTLAICSDSVWLWNHWLIHYIEEHDVRIPESFYTHMEACQFKVVIPVFEDSEAALRSLDWSAFPQGCAVLGICSDNPQ
jgi:hypothetical protein